MQKTSHKPASRQARERRVVRALEYGLAGMLLLGGLGTLFAYIPEMQPPSLSTQVLVWGLAAIASGFNVWNRLRPNPWAGLLTGFWLDNAVLALAIKGLGYGSPDPLWLAPLIVGYALAWLLPLASPQLAAFLYTAQTAPRTRAGRLALRGLLYLIVLLGGLGRGLSRSGNDTGVMLLLGGLAALIAVALADSTVHRFWVLRGLEQRQETREE